MSKWASMVIGIIATAMAGLIDQMGTILNANHIVMGVSVRHDEDERHVAADCGHATICCGVS